MAKLTIGDTVKGIFLDGSHIEGKIIKADKTHFLVHDGRFKYRMLREKVKQVKDEN